MEIHITIPKSGQFRQDKYLKRGGQHCPACNSTRIEEVPLFNEDEEDGEFHRRMECERCGASWNAMYVLVGYMPERNPLIEKYDWPMEVNK